MIPRIVLLVLAAVAVVHSLPQQQSGDLDSLIKDIFGEDPANGGNSNNVGTPNQGQNTGQTSPPPPPPPDNQGGDNLGEIPDGNSGSRKDVRNNPDNDGDCTCVPYYLCPNGTVLTDGTGLLDIRAKPGACEEYMDVCCKNPLDESKPIKPEPLARKGCGQRHPDGVGFRITGDNNNEAQFGEFPWMVAMLKRTVLDDGSDLMVYQCGGALIHERIVLTAAHCVVGNNDGSEMIARLGEWDTQTTNEIYRHQNVKVSKVAVHPGFKRNNLHNDFALLLLETPATLGENVDTVCLPNTGYVPLSRECYATGWGKDKFDEEDEISSVHGHSWHHARRPRHLPILSGIRSHVRSILEGFHTREPVGSVWPSHRARRIIGKHSTWRGRYRKPGEKGQYQVILKKIDLPIVPKDHCQSLLRKTRLGPFYKLDDSFVCAGGIVGKDTCKGDGGSPLVCPIEGKSGTYEVTGLVAWGIGCGDETPGVYAGVAYARSWIDTELSKLGISLEK